MSDIEHKFAKHLSTLSAIIIGNIEILQTGLEIMCKNTGKSPEVAEYLFNKMILEILERFPSLQEGDE